MTDLYACSAGTLARLIRDGEISAGRGDRGAPGADRAGQPGGERRRHAGRRAGAWRRPARPTGGARPAPRCRRCTGCRSCTRTPTRRPGSAPRWARRSWPTTCPDVDELIIARLRAAGTIALGKTNVPEFAAGSHTFNPLFGLPATRTTRPARRAAAAAARRPRWPPACARSPTAATSAARCATRPRSATWSACGRPSAGCRPTPTRCPWHNLGVGGPMARTVDDVALLLSVIAGPDPRVPVSLAEPGSSFARGAPARCPRRCASRSARTSAARCRSTRRSSRRSRRRPGVRRARGRVEPALPDLRGAEEAFRIRRAWLFATNLGPVLDAAATRSRPPSAGTSSRAGHCAPPTWPARSSLLAALYERTAAFFAQLRRAAAADHPGAAVRRRPGVPDPDRRPGAGSYLDWMRSCSDITATGAPAITRARPASARAGSRSGCRSSGRTAVRRRCSAWPSSSRRPPATPPAGRRGRPRVRGGSPGRRAGRRCPSGPSAACRRSPSSSTASG